jgi:hypothetical protein
MTPRGWRAAKIRRHVRSAIVSMARRPAIRHLPHHLLHHAGGCGQRSGPRIGPRPGAARSASAAALVAVAGPGGSGPRVPAQRAGFAAHRPPASSLLPILVARKRRRSLPPLVRASQSRRAVTLPRSGCPGYARDVADATGTAYLQSFFRQRQLRAILRRSRYNGTSGPVLGITSRSIAGRDSGPGPRVSRARTAGVRPAPHRRPLRFGPLCAGTTAGLLTWALHAAALSTALEIGHAAGDTCFPRSCRRWPSWLARAPLVARKSPASRRSGPPRKRCGLAMADAWAPGGLPFARRCG